MLIRYGFDIEFDIFQPTTVLTATDLVNERKGDVLEEQALASGAVRASAIYVDPFGNRRRRIEAMPGTVHLHMRGTVRDSGEVDPQVVDAREVPIAELPSEALPFLLGSRYCETDLLADTAWSLFGGIEGGFAKVQAVCDFVHEHIRFGYEHARPTRTALESYQERVGVCRDFTHLAIAFCRALNIPARYCNGYLGDIGVPPNPAPMDFNAWLEAYIGDDWYVFDARHNIPRIGRITVARGRDAMDIPILHSFGPHMLKRFEVITEELPEGMIQLAAE